MKTFLSTVAFAVLIPSSAFAAFCPFSDAKAVKCEIPLCIQAGFPSSDGCRPALREFIKRIFKRKPPVPLPPECMCTWIPPVVIPTNKDGIPFFLEDSIPYGAAPVDGLTIQYAQADFIPHTPFEKRPSYTKVAAATTQAPTQAQINARTSSVLASQDVFYTNCNSGMFSSGSSANCFIRSDGERIDIQVKRSRYGSRLRRRYKYDYVVTTRNQDGTGDVFTTHMNIRHKTVQFCRIFKNGQQISDQNCNAGNIHSFVNTDLEDETPYTDPTPFPREFPGTPDQELPVTEPAPKPKDDGVFVFE